MGAWGIHFDECDGALDFIGDVEESRDWSNVGRQIATYIDDGGYENGEETLAALELVAAGLGHPSPRLRPELAEWARTHGSEAVALNERAVHAAELIRSQSELSELWAEADEGADWQATIIDLRTRLQT